MNILSKIYQLIPLLSFHHLWLDNPFNHILLLEFNSDFLLVRVLFETGTIKILVKLKKY